MRRIAFFAMLAATVAVLPAALGAQEYEVGALTVDHPWARATAPHAPAGIVYLGASNAGSADDRLVGVTVGPEVAEAATLHTSEMADDVMQMLPVEGIVVPAGGSAVLAPGGDHIMLTGLGGPLVKDTRFPITLVFEAAGEVVVEVDVESAGAMEPTP